MVEVWFHPFLEDLSKFTLKTFKYGRISWNFNQVFPGLGYSRNLSIFFEKVKVSFWVAVLELGWSGRFFAKVSHPWSLGDTWLALKAQRPHTPTRHAPPPSPDTTSHSPKSLKFWFGAKKIAEQI